MSARIRDVLTRHPFWYYYALLALLGIDLWLTSASPIVGAAILGGCLAVVLVLHKPMVRRWERTFPPGLDREQRLTIQRIVLSGAAVRDPALAWGVVYHARVLRARSTPVAWWAMIAGSTLATAAFVLDLIAEGFHRESVNLLVLVVILASTVLVALPPPGRLARYTAQAEHHALSLLHSAPPSADVWRPQ